MYTVNMAIRLFTKMTNTEATAEKNIYLIWNHSSLFIATINTNDAKKKYCIPRPEKLESLSYEIIYFYKLKEYLPKSLQNIGWISWVPTKLLIAIIMKAIMIVMT